MTCHDCKKELIEDEEYMPYKLEGGEFYKCKECHQKDPVLRNFQETEVYSRVCGYIRPVKQFNAAKQLEFQDRVDFKPDVSSLCSGN